MNPVIALIITNIIWGMSPPIFKFALDAIPPFTLAFIRFFFAALLFIPFLRKWQPMTIRDWTEIVVGAFFGIFLNITFFFMGLTTSAPSINVTIIGSAGPVFLYLISIIFLKESPNKRVLGGMLLALGGVLTIILAPLFLGNQRLELSELKGNLFYVLATIGAVLYPVLSKRALSKINPLQVTFIGFIVSGVLFFLLALNERANWNMELLNTHALVGVGFGLFLCSFVGYLLFNIGTSKIKAQEIGIFTYIDPVAAVLVAMPLLHEFPTTYFLVGAFLVAIGILIAEGRFQYHPIHLLGRKYSPVRLKTAAKTKKKTIHR
jgi:drug/metabolite transporter (DMT)-like permease